MENKTHAHIYIHILLQQQNRTINSKEEKLLFEHVLTALLLLFSVLFWIQATFYVSVHNIWSIQSELNVPARLFIRWRLICILRKTVEITCVQRSIHLQQQYMFIISQTHFLWTKSKKKQRNAFTQDNNTV